jgi:hypothetical protein
VHRGKRVLTIVHWASGALLVVAVLVCIVTANFFFPTADQAAALGGQPLMGTFFHPGEPAAIRLWKISFAIGGIAVAVLMLAALLHGLLYPPTDQTQPPRT